TADRFASHPPKKQDRTVQVSFPEAVLRAVSAWVQISVTPPTQGFEASRPRHRLVEAAIGLRMPCWVPGKREAPAKHRSGSSEAPRARKSSALLGRWEVRRHRPEPQ